ncbi:hypothetical protein V6L77_19415 [Pannonibacter sp. Pt2-lr]
MGKLGGEEMTASSDLDLILLYDVPEDATGSDGARPLPVSQYYIRLTQRLVTACPHLRRKAASMRWISACALRQCRSAGHQHHRL